MTHRSHWRLGHALPVALAVSVMAPLAGPSAAQAQGETPRYITAKPDRVANAFGRGVAAKIFSGDYTTLRQQAVLRSQRAIPGFDCPADPQIALAEVIPFPVRQGAVSWIERFVLGCTPPTMRNFLLILEGEQPRVLELLPGRTNADPRLQRDALQSAAAIAVVARPQGCDKPIVTETRITTPPERGGLWVERWSYDLCGTKAEVDVTFTPSGRGGTDWSATPVK
jgi:hypothetical protein